MAHDIVISGHYATLVEGQWFSVTGDAFGLAPNRCCGTQRGRARDAL
jgi:hypothetical protein